MTNTPFSKKCEILDSLASEVNVDAPCLPIEFINQFIFINDLAIPLARLYLYGYCSVTDSGVDLIQDAWIDLCKTLGIDSYGEYESIDDMADLFYA